MARFRIANGPDDLLRDYSRLFTGALKHYPILDLACGDGHNGLFLSGLGFRVLFADRSREALAQVRKRAEEARLPDAEIVRTDLESADMKPVFSRIYSAILVFRFLHRPLIPIIREALMPGGLLVYETFTEDQARFGKPCNPEHLLRAGELASWFSDWETIHRFEGITGEPPRAVAQIVCRKPQQAVVKLCCPERLLRSR